MKTILVPTDPHLAMESSLGTALLAGRLFDSYIEGFALRPAPIEYIPIDMVGGLTWAGNDINDDDVVEQAHALFDGFMRQHAVPPRPGVSGGLGYGWLDNAPFGEAFAGSYGRVFDLTVVARPSSGQPRSSMLTLEAALFESGRPILMAPPSTPRTLGECVVIAWNGSDETARAASFAQPFLERARRIVVLTVESGMVPGPTGEQVATWLRRNGFEAEAITAPPDRRGPGEAILSIAGSLGCDLLVKGAYTQSRLRQMIFGGATSYILSNATLPVLLAH
jgi:nucleotide-binding universal stress UspA family protein